MEPLRFAPIFKRTRWGGTRLGGVLGKAIGHESDYAESWELADHGDDQSIVRGGRLDGMTLQDLLKGHNQAVLGRHAGRPQFPLLIKFLDANDRLSVQVHPDDAKAKTFDPSENGKTEAWVIIDAEPGSRLYAGLREGVQESDLRAALESGTVEECLHSFEVSAGDCVFIPAGTVHAIAEGILLAEVQQSSDLTFRLYDWGRVGADGKPREIHIEQAMACTDFARGPVNCQQPRSVNGGEELVVNDYFAIRRFSGPGQLEIPDDYRFHILMGLHGEASVVSGSHVECLKPGHTLLLPAERASSSINLATNNTALDVFLP